MNTKKIKKGIVYYFAAAGVAAHIGLAVGAVYLFSTYQLTFRQFLVKATEKAGVDSPLLTKAITASSMFPDHQMDGRLVTGYPRILLTHSPAVTTSSILQHRMRSFKEQRIAVENPCKNGFIVAQAACWSLTADDSVAKQVIHQLKSFQLVTPDVRAEYGNAWQLAFAFDLVSGYSGFSDDDRTIIQHKLKKALKEYIALLNESGPSLWHGRTTLASTAWLVAVTLDPSDAESKELISQAQAHFLDVISAAELTEAWPEGYNYWIQNRAFLLALAANAYINGLENSMNKNRVKRLLERIGFWHIYATRPDDRIEGLGDEGSRVDLKDETQRVIDLIAQATNNPVFAQYSRYISLLHGNEAYYRDYRWGKLLFANPDILSLPQKNKSLSNFRSLPTTDVFGKDAFNQFYLRSGWGDKDTFISYRAGHSFTHHGHYDAGHFSIFKGKPLAINSSVYGKYTGENRLNYSIRTIAKNSLLILRPGEKVKPNRFFTENVAAGGQRIVMPTGSTIDNTQDWFSNLYKGNHYEAGKLLRFDFDENKFTYIKSDLTGAYNNTAFDDGGRGGKVKKVERTLLYLNKSDQLIVFDKILATKADFTKKWLLHSVNKPKTSQLTILQGTKSNGILSTSSNYALIQNDNAYLHVQKILPKKSELRLVGGPDYQYYVEVDGDDSTLNGKNMNQDASTNPWFDVGMWRMEIQPVEKHLYDEFLVVMSPRYSKAKPASITEVNLNDRHKAIISGDQLIVFADENSARNIKATLPVTVRRILFVNIPSNALLNVMSGSSRIQKQASSNGTVSFNKLRSFRKGNTINVSW